MGNETTSCNSSLLWKWVEGLHINQHQPSLASLFRNTPHVTITNERFAYTKLLMSMIWVEVLFVLRFGFAKIVRYKGLQESIQVSIFVILCTTMQCREVAPVISALSRDLLPWKTKSFCVPLWLTENRRSIVMYIRVCFHCNSRSYLLILRKDELTINRSSWISWKLKENETFKELLTLIESGMGGSAWNLLFTCCWKNLQQQNCIKISLISSSIIEIGRASCRERV